MNTFLQQPIVMLPGSCKTLNFLGVRHKLTGAQNRGVYYKISKKYGMEWLE